MKKFFGIILLVITTGFFSHTFAVDDYIWEEKFKKALPKAEQGDTKSQYAIGEMFEKGKGTIKDPKKAFEWYHKAAKQNNKKAAYKVGRAYLEGKGVSRNYKKAHDWFRSSANQKYVRAEYYLGALYEYGQGVSKNYNEALKWYKQALAGGYSRASDGIKRVAKAQKSAEQKRRAAIVKTVKPKTVPKPKPKPVPKIKSTKDKVLAGGWKKRNKPVEYLPSSLTQCKNEEERVECQSVDISRNIGMADISYTTKATLFDFEDNGSFNISYRNNVSKITVTDPEFAESGRKVPVTLGWQDADHELACQFENDRSLTCTKNKLRKITLRR
ncbi:MAG: sel1 repeat family protein [Gammaproteobacteria bacterium]|nr:sel1 repeat family protein [Gammaproteobacteria bacterium]